MNKMKYFCQDQHRQGRCNIVSVQKQCVKSCACPDDHYSSIPGRFASQSCPFPHKYPVSNRTLIVINSNAQSIYSNILSRDLSGLWHLIVYGNSKTTRLSKQNSTMHLRVQHDSIDFTAIISVADHYQRLSKLYTFDRIFYMHDTMIVHNRSAFVKALEKYNQRRTCSLQMGQSMNIGMYAVHDILRLKSTIRMLRGRNNSTKEERIELKKKGFRGWEGILFDKSNAWASYSKCGCELSRGPDSKRVIDTGIFRGRKELRYESWGLSKFQHTKKHDVQ